MPALKDLSVQDLSEHTEEQVKIADITACQYNPLHLLYSEKHLSIKTKTGDLIKLRLNTTQQRLFAKIRELRLKGKPIRMWILKFRQGGVSTEIEALIYSLTSQQPNRNSLIMADEKDKASYLFDMSKLYQEKLEEERPYLVPELKKSNSKSLEWEAIHSQVIIESAENLKAARAYTYQYVHLSEVAYFPDLKAILDGLNQSVPGHADTMIIGETTANGMNQFYKEWMRAIEGKTDWIPLFLPWFIMEEYRMPLQSGELYPLEGINFDADSSQLTFEQEERELQEEFELDSEQINWRRWAIVNKCQGSITTFRTEYPATWQEAFSMSGSMFFDKKGLEKQKEHKAMAIGDVFQLDMKWEFRALEHGPIKVYEKPVAGGQYIIPGDASEAVGSDEASILVLNKQTNATCAVVAGQHSPEELARMMIGLGNYYNQAILAPENGGYGYMVCQIVNRQYGNVYRRMRTQKGTDEQTEEIGFRTTSVTRPQMLAQMNEEIKHNSTELRAKELLEQCHTFIIKKDKDGKVTKVEAQSGYQDGLVICRAIASMVRSQYPYVKPVEKSTKAQRRVAYHEKTKHPNAGFSFKGN